MPEDIFDVAMGAVDRAMDGVSRAMDDVGKAMDHVGDVIQKEGGKSGTKIRVRLSPDHVQKLLAGKSLTFTVANTQITIEKGI